MRLFTPAFWHTLGTLTIFNHREWSGENEKILITLPTIEFGPIAIQLNVY